MLNNQMRTLLFPTVETPPVEAVARECSATSKRTETDGFRLSFPDGSSLVVKFWTFDAPGGRVSKSLLAMTARFRERRLRNEPDDRRKRILARLQKSKVVMSLGVPPPRSLSPQALAFIDALAKRTGAMVYDLRSLYTPDGKKLLGVDGFVADDVPAEYPEVPKTPPRPPVTRWTDTPFIIVPSFEPFRRSEETAPGISRIVRESPSGREELARRLLDVMDRVRTAKVSAAAQEHRTRLGFELARAKVLVEARDVETVTKRLHGMSVGETEIRDAGGRLVLSTTGNSDPRALSPRRLLILSNQDPLTVAPRLSESGLRVSPIDVPQSSEPLCLRAMEFKDMRVRLRRRAARRRSRIEQFLLGPPKALDVLSNAPLDPAQIARVLTCVRSLRGMVFDGWGFYDHRGRALLVLSGAFDPQARFLRQHGE